MHACVHIIWRLLWAYAKFVFTSGVYIIGGAYLIVMDIVQSLFNA